jgi:predicted HTH transcriptional regulator
MLDIKSYYELLNEPVPNSNDAVSERFVQEKILIPDESGISISNLGATLFARNLGEFDSLARKGIRLIEYRGSGRSETIREQTGSRGYASGFVGLLGFLKSWLPSNEVIRDALRVVVPTYPDIAIRELTANALIHQDFSMSGSSPTIEIFVDRIEFTNPGSPLIEPSRFLDSPPRSRNDRLANLMRRLTLCEERGSGIDKVVTAVELYQLPAPTFVDLNGFTKATLFAPKKLEDMDRQERNWACYLHACLMRVTNQYLTNTSVRKRFGLRDEEAAKATRIIQDAKNAGLIKDADPDNSSPRLSKYMPHWA